MRRMSQSIKASAMTVLLFITMVGAHVRQKAADLVPAPSGPHGAASADGFAAAVREERAQGLGDILLGSITLALAFVVSLVFFPIITSSVNTAQLDGNTTAQDSAMLALLPTIFVVVLVVAGVNRLVSGIREFRS